MNYLDLFSGIGGFALGFQQAGINIEKHYFSEVDKYAISIYRRYFPDAIPLGDVARIKNINERIDLISGGFPCQSFSIAGKRRGFSDTRGTLFFDIARLAKELRPKYMVLENVKGIYSHDDGHTLDVILSTLDGLDYDVQLLLVNSKDFGVPQNRERAFFVCNFRGKSRPKILSLREQKKICTTSPTLTTRYPGSWREGLYIIENGEKWRDLTPVECERLQGFPDNWTEGISDTQRYKTLGNAVTVNVIKAIGESLKEAMNENTI